MFKIIFQHLLELLCSILSDTVRLGKMWRDICPQTSAKNFRFDFSRLVWVTQLFLTCVGSKMYHEVVENVCVSGKPSFGREKWVLCKTFLLCWNELCVRLFYIQRQPKTFSIVYLSLFAGLCFKRSIDFWSLLSIRDLCGRCFPLWSSVSAFCQFWSTFSDRVRKSLPHLLHSFVTLKEYFVLPFSAQ